MNLKKIASGKIELLLFLSFFALYFAVGYNLIVTNESASTLNVYFFSDTSRVFSDLTDTVRINDLLITEINHYRSLVHPVFLIIFNPIVQFLNLLFNNYLVTVVFLQSVIAAVNITLLFAIFKLFDVNKLTATLLCIVYGFSFTQFVFASQIETFLYAAFFLLLFWLYTFSKYKEKTEININSVVILSVLGCLCLGITITNFAQFLMGLGLLLYNNEKNNFKRFTVFISVLFLALSLTIMLNNIQIGFWRSSGNFVVYFIDFLMNPANDEKTYIELGFSLQSFKNILQGFMMHNFISPKINFDEAFSLGTYEIWQKIALCLNGVMLATTAIGSIVKKNTDSKHVIILITCLLLNMLLHVLYGNEELFLYTQHFTFLIVIIYGVSSKDFTKNGGIVLNVFLLVFVISQVYTNLSSVKFMVETVNQLYSSHEIYINELKPFYFIGGAVFFIIMIITVKTVMLSTLVNTKRIAICVGAVTVLICVIVGAKFKHDSNLHKEIMESPHTKVVYIDDNSIVYRLNNKLLFAYKKQEKIVEILKNHTFSIENENNLVYKRENINFTKETGSKLLYSDSYIYFIKEIYMTSIKDVAVETFSH